MTCPAAEDVQSLPEEARVVVDLEVLEARLVLRVDGEQRGVRRVAGEALTGDAREVLGLDRGALEIVYHLGDGRDQAGEGDSVSYVELEVAEGGVAGEGLEDVRQEQIPLERRDAAEGMVVRDQD